MVQNKRINKEIQNMMKDNNLNQNNYAIELIQDSTTHFYGKIRGAPDTPFAYGVFTIDINIPDKYPFEPPVCKFVTRVWHPNISSQTGVICLDILKDQWAAAMTVESVLTSLQSFLSSPEPHDPQDAVVAQQFMSDRSLYDKTAKYWTYVYAVSEKDRQKFKTTEFRDFEKKIQEYIQGTRLPNRDKAISALSCNNWDVQRAIAGTQ